MNEVLEALAWYLVFLFSVTFHEAAHAWAAMRGGDLTAYSGGQVSLDPIPHIRREPFGMVILPLISLIVVRWPFGFASAPYDPYWAERHPKRAAWMSLAGPGSNLLLVLIAALLIRLGMHLGWLRNPDSVGYAVVTMATQTGPWVGAATLLSMLFSLNLILTIFNLLPLPPLDGTGALPLILSEESSRRYRLLMGQTAFMWMGMLAAWAVFPAVFNPVFRLAVNLLYPGHTYG